jgi:hypothetical protein
MKCTVQESNLQPSDGGSEKLKMDPIRASEMIAFQTDNSHYKLPAKLPANRSEKEISDTASPLCFVCVECAP